MDQNDKLPEIVGLDGSSFTLIFAAQFSPAGSSIFNIYVMNKYQEDIKTELGIYKPEVIVTLCATGYVFMLLYCFNTGLNDW